MTHNHRAMDGNGCPDGGQTLYREQERRPAMLPVPDGMVVGRPFRTLSAGTVRSRYSGEPRGETITAEHLADMARLVVGRAEHDPVVIDWGHGSSPSMPDSTDPVRAASLGLVVGAYVEDEGDGRGPGLYIIPAYTPRGASLVEDQRGALWSSPEFVLGDVFARMGDEPTRVGGAQLLAVALTNRPAQQASSVDAIMMTDAAPVGAQEDAMNDEMDMAPADDEVEDKDSIIAELRARIAELEGKMAEGEAASVQSLTERAATLAGEVQTLREQVQVERKRAHDAERERAIDVLFAEGRIDGGDETRAACRDAYDVRETHPRWWATYADAPVGRFGVQRSSLPGGASEEQPVSGEDRGLKLAEQVRRIVSERKMSWADAVRAARAEAPSAWEGV